MRIAILSMKVIQVPIELWKERKPFQTPMYLLGIILVVSGLFHVLVWALSGGSWAGPVAWRKPILFGITGGITTLSLAWVLGLLPFRKYFYAMSWVYTVCMFVEVGLITMQKWRGTASHFNYSTSLDAAIFRVMGSLIMVVALIIFTMTFLSFRGLNAKREMALAVRSGLILLSVSNLLGLFLSIYGSYIMQASPGHAPNIFGQAGAMKFPHALTLHAIQILPFLAWILDHTSRDSGSKFRLMKSAVAGYSGLQIFALLQTFRGRAPQDVTPLSALIGIVSAVVFAAPFFLVLIGKDQSDSMRPQEVQ